ncbi:PAS domain S-box protein [Methanosphaerula palustris]|nr:PAS domain S-box protein [Methanosphaerula palustris]
MLIGHRTSDPIPKELLNIYLAVAGLVTNALAGAYKGFKNIKARKRAEESLEYERKQLLSLFNSIDEIIYVSDLYTYEVLYMNDAFLRLLKKDAVGGLCYQELQGLDHPCEFCTNEILLKNRDKPYRWEYHNPFINRDFEIVDRVITWPDGRDVRFEFAKDITERKVAEDALLVKNQIFETTVEGVSLIRTCDEVIVYTNSKFEKMFGYEKGELIGNHVSVVNAPNDEMSPRSSAEEIMKALDEMGKWRGEVKNIRKDDTIVWCSVVVSTFEHPDFGSVWISAHTDITERKQAEEAVQTAVKLNQLIDTMSVSECMSFTLDEAERLTSSRIGFFHFVDPDEQMLHLVTWSTETRKHCSIPEEHEQNYPVSKAGVWVDCLRERKPVIHNDYISLPHKKGLSKAHIPVTRELVVPIFDEDTIVAIIGVGNKTTDYDEMDIDVLTLLASNVWTLIQRKRAEEALKESEQKFREIFNNVNDGIELYEFRSDDLPGNYLEVNDVTCRMLQYSREELLHHSPLDFITDSHKSSLSDIRKELVTLGLSQFETEYRRRDGTIVPVEINAHIVVLHEKNMLLSVVRDITERKKIEEEERLTRERFEMLLKVSEMQDASETDLSEYVMEVACRMTGSTFAFIGIMTSDESVMDLISWSRSTMLDCKVAVSPIHFPVQRAGIWADAIRTHKPKIVNHYSAPHPGKKGLPVGHVRITRFLSLPILVNGKVVLVVAVANKLSDYDEADVTRLTLMMQGVWGNLQKRRSDEALKMSEEKFRDIFNNTSDAMHLHLIGDAGSPGRFTDINDVACRMIGYTREEMLAKTPLEIAVDYYNPSLEKNIEEQRTIESARFETEYRTKDGMLIPVEVNTHVVTILGKKLMLGTARDISERKRVEEALQLVNKKLNLLSSITRHDINNQIFALKAFLELSKESLDDFTMTSECLCKAERAANAIERQIAFTKEYQDLGVHAPVWQSVDASITKALTVLPMRDVRIASEVNDLEVFADPLFEKVFYNLIDNALKYGGQRMTVIRVSSQKSKRGLVISVENDGVGISAEDKKRLFERGFGHNTGLGLFLSREILAITGITITEAGESGQCARFEMIVPKGGYRFVSEA